MNWGKKIAVTYTVFVVFMVTMVYLSFGLKFDLVTEDYYAEEIKFQEKIDSKTRVKEQGLEPIISIIKNTVSIKFPNTENTKYSGTIQCFRPSDENKDFTIEFSNIEEPQLIDSERFSKGKYLMKIDWTDGTHQYYSEQTVIIP